MKTKIHLYAMMAALPFLFGACHDHADHDHDHGSAPHAEAGEADDDHDDHADEAKHLHAGEIIFTREQARTGGVETEELGLRPFHGVIQAGGQIRSAQNDEVTVSATANGIVTPAVNDLTEGMAVTAGRPLVRISSRDIQDGDPVAKARNAYETARRQYLRDVEMQKEGILSTKELENSEKVYRDAQISYENIAKNATDKGVGVSSPISGFVKSLAVTPGSYVTVGQPIATVSKNRRLQLRAYLPESYFAQAAQITGAHFRTSYDNRLYKLEELNGRLLSSGKSADDTGGYIPVTFEFDNRGAVIPGTYADVYLMTAPAAEALTVPLAALTEEQGAHFVYTHEGGDVYKRREVRVGIHDGERIQVLSGLEKGQKVVVKGSYLIKLAANASVIPEGHSHNH